MRIFVVETSSARFVIKRHVSHHKLTIQPLNTCQFFFALLSSFSRFFSCSSGRRTSSLELFFIAHINIFFWRFPFRFGVCSEKRMHPRKNLKHPEPMMDRHAMMCLRWKLTRRNIQKEKEDEKRLF